MTQRQVTIDLDALTDQQIELAFDAVLMAHDLLDRQGYKSGDIVDGLVYAAGILNACQNVATGRYAGWIVNSTRKKEGE